MEGWGRVARAIPTVPTVGIPEVDRLDMRLANAPGRPTVADLLKLAASLVVLTNDDEEPITESVGITGSDPFELGAKLVEWLRARADELETAMEADRA